MGLPLKTAQKLLFKIFYAIHPVYGPQDGKQSKTSKQAIERHRIQTTIKQNTERRVNEGTPNETITPLPTYGKQR